METFHLLHNSWVLVMVMHASECWIIIGSVCVSASSRFRATDWTDADLSSAIKFQKHITIKFGLSSFKKIDFYVFVSHFSGTNELRYTFSLSFPFSDKTDFKIVTSDLFS